jgi:hypothetical protein
MQGLAGVKYNLRQKSSPFSPRPERSRRVEDWGWALKFYIIPQSTNQFKIPKTMVYSATA